MNQGGSETFDLVVIGGGPAGTSGANGAALTGRMVALVERTRVIGGAGINTGTIPSKTLRESAIALSGWRSRRLFGVDLSLRREATVGDFMHHEKRVTADERQRLEHRLRANRVREFHGSASFVDAHTVKVTAHDGSVNLLRGEFILIATGSSPVRPPEFAFGDDRIHDSNEILHLKTLPKKLAVVGGGVVGSEYASTFAALGAEVHLIDGREVLLPFLDAEVSRSLASAMAANGVTFHWKERVTRCDVSKAGDVVLTLSSGATLACDGVLVCAGRSSNTESLNLPAAGLTPGKRGLVVVDAHYRSAVPHIYAAGDVIGPPALAATSVEQARVAICHAFEIGLKREMAPLLPTGIYTIPEASMAGETEESLKEKQVDYVVGRARYADNPRGQIIGDRDGFLKLLFRRDDLRLLGVHVVGEQATEVVHVGLMALLAGADADIFNRACFNYPTLGDLYKYAAYDAILQRVGGFPAAIQPASLENPTMKSEDPNPRVVEQPAPEPASRAQVNRRQPGLLTGLSAVVAAGTLALLAGCAVGPKYQRPQVDSPADFRNAPGVVATNSLADLPWWDVYKDETLRTLIQAALTNNYDVRIAASRVEQARQLSAQARSQFFPSIGYGGAVSRGRNEFLGSPNSNGGSTGDAALATVNAAWEVDLWGRIRRLNESARAQYLATEEAQRGVMLSLVSDVALAYFELLELDLQLQIALRTAGSFEESLKMFTQRLEGGVASRLDTSRAAGALATTSAQVPEVQRQIALKENQINVLLGRNPGPVGRNVTMLQQVMPPEVPAGLPSALLERRPDILAAEQNLRSANALIGVAVAEFLPKIGLTAFLGKVSPELSAFTAGSANAWSIAASAAGPLFQGGALRAQYRQAKAAWEQARLEYERTALNAFQEVSNALVSREKFAATAVQFDQAVTAYQESVRVSTQRYLAGKASYFEVLEAQQLLFPAENSLARSQLNQLIVVVQLYRALGGGWNLDNPQFISGR